MIPARLLLMLPRGALPQRPWPWPPAAVGGPYYVLVGETFTAGSILGALYHPGNQAGETYRPGSIVGALFHPGAETGELFVPGATIGETKA